jgi:hypothetical protein
MNKTMPLIVIALVCSIAATGLTFLMSDQNTKISCFEPDIIMGANNPLLDEVRPPSTMNADSPPVYAIERGFPVKYYRQAFPANCTLPDGFDAPTSSQLEIGHLVIDLLVWAALTCLVLFGFKRVRSKR